MDDDWRYQYFSKSPCHPKCMLTSPGFLTLAIWIWWLSSRLLAMFNEHGVKFSRQEKAKQCRKLWISWLWICHNMGGSWNRGTPKSSILVGFSLTKTNHFGYPHLWTPPYGFKSAMIWVRLLHPRNPAKPCTSLKCSKGLSFDVHWLVVGLPCLAFSQSYWECHHPNWRTHIFQRGGPTTNQYRVVDSPPWDPRFVFLVWEKHRNLDDFRDIPQTPEIRTRRSWRIWCHGHPGRVWTDLTREAQQFSWVFLGLDRAGWSPRTPENCQKRNLLPWFMKKAPSFALILGPKNSRWSSSPFFPWRLLGIPKPQPRVRGPRLLGMAQLVGAGLAAVSRLPSHHGRGQAPLTGQV